MNQGMICDNLNEEDLTKPDRADQILALARICLGELTNLEYHWRKQRNDGVPVVSESESERFFRFYERNKNISLIIQYLQLFTEKLPDKEEISSAPVNPFSQMISFLDYAIELLSAEDVIEAALGVNRELGLVDHNTSWYYRGRIENIYRDLRERIEPGLQPDKEGYRVLLDVIQDLCCFWFAFRNENRRVVRKSDICLYQLCRLVRIQNKIPPYQKKSIN